MDVTENIDNAVEEAIAQGDKWRFANATSTQRQGINVWRADGSMEWYVRCEAPYEKVRYTLHRVYQPA